MTNTRTYHLSRRPFLCFDSVICLSCNKISKALHSKHVNMIFQIITTTGTGSTTAYRTPQRPLKKSIKLILSQHSIFMIVLGLMFANMIVISMRLALNDTACVGCSEDHYRHPIDRYFPRIAYCTKRTFNMTEYEKSIQVKRYVTDIGNEKSRWKISNQDSLDLDIVEDENCKLRSAWQRTSFPTCNSVHEFDGTNPWSKITSKSNGQRRRQKLYRIIGNGFWRDVWLVNYEHGMLKERGIFKTMRFPHPYTPRNFDRMRRDSVTMERLTKSPFIVNIYAFCGTTSLSEYGDGGDIPDALWPTKTNSSSLSQINKLRIATQAAIALATVHSIDGDEYPTIAHTDIMPAQFIKVNDRYKLNDFNRARFIAYKHDGNNQMCPYQIGSNPGRNRSPEEYNYEPQTEKVDVYSLGNIFYMLLQGEWPFYDVSQEMATELVKNGTRPSVYFDLWFSTDPVDIALKEAMIMCHEQNATQRASARDVEYYLTGKMRDLDYQQLNIWGLS